ncbi:MAG: PDZ domain-containing protein [Chloroflexi bacterium]|nr:PDZ domain-containing protein [Chloroflexota bacterium]
MPAGYYRFPTIHGDTLVFASEDDLWSVPTSGGLARRLTSNLGEVSYPMLSPDGEWLAYVGQEEGASEVYVMPATGGRSHRLTYLSSGCRVLGWTPDSNQIIFASNYGQVVWGEYSLFTIAREATNGIVTPLPYGPARSIAFGPQGQVLLGRNTGDPARWKRYRGGTAGHLWIDRTGDGQFERFMATLKGNIAAPMWITMPSDGAAETPDRQQERIFFISDHEGIGNLYSCLADDSDLRRHTDHEGYYVRNPSSDGKRIVYHVGADLYLYDVATDRETLINIEFYSPRMQRNRKFVDAGRYLDSARLHPSGKAIGLTTRGKAFAFYNHDGPVLQYGKRDGVRYRLPEWLNDGRSMVLISDDPGEEAIEIHYLDPKTPMQRLDGLDIGRAVLLKASPVEDKLAITNHRHELLIVDLKTRALTLVDRSPHKVIASVDWAPDGRWLAYGFSATVKTTEIRLYRLADPVAEDEALRQGSVHTVTHPVLHDVKPAFDPEGRYLYFLSYREFNPVYDSLHFELGFPWGMRPYLVTLRADLPNPFIPRPDLEEEDEDKDEDEDADEDDEDTDEDVAADDDEADDEGDDGDEGEDDEDDAEGDEEEDLDENDDELGDADEADDADDDAGEDDPGEPDELNFVSKQARETPPANIPNANPPVTGKGATTPDKEKDKKTPKSVRPIHIDLDGIARRVIAFPVPDGRYGQITGVTGKALFTTLPVNGLLDGGEEWDDERDLDYGILRAYNFKEYKLETQADNVNAFDLSRNRKKLLYAFGRRLRVINAGEKAPSEGGHPRKTGWVDLHRVKVAVNPQAEWEQMFREAWRLQRDHFWTEDMSQVDWQTVYQRYFPLIDRVSTRSEFSDLMWEMQGELGTSHAYEYGGDYRQLRPYYGQGFLGTTFTWDAAAGGYRVGEIIVGDPWNKRATSPLAAPGVDVQPGDLLLSINGQALDEQIGPAQLLMNQAGHEVMLTFVERKTNGKAPPLAASVPDVVAAEKAKSHKSEVHTRASLIENSEPDAEKRQTLRTSRSELHTRNVVVAAIYNETGARYRAWVEKNRQRVHEATNGRMGYVHIPDMGATGYAEFHRGYLAEVDRDGLIIDVRYNSGGHVSQLILEKLARRRIGYDLSRWGGLSPYPTDSVAGPLVALTNESAGSDGDIFCHSFKLLKLGPLIGKRTWGGVIGISPHHALVDGTVTTQPEYSFWFEDVGWNVENYGTDPDIEVDNTPQDYVANRDVQLERAITEALRLLEITPINKPDLAQRPSRALPTLPPRQSRAKE